ncbi:PKD domain-containing protein, partial [bacterium]|nr:PKD domain-containing protein [candidate division CSSED10-310 bacterium]
VHVVFVDNTGPVVHIVAPADGSCIENGGVAVSGTADDGADGAGVDSVLLSTDGGVNWTAAEGTDEWSVWFDLQGMGIFHVYAKAIDAIGNESATSHIRVFVDDASPDVSVSVPVESRRYVGTELVAQGIAHDQTAGVDHVHLRLDGGSWQQAEGTDEWQLPLTNLADGYHVLDARATDRCGNLTLPAESVGFYIDNSGPEIMAAGFLYSRLRSDGPLQLTVIAYTEDNQTESMEVSSAGTPIAMLRDDGLEGDFTAGDGLYTYSLDVGEACVPGVSLLLEIQAVDALGNRGRTWPYLEVRDSMTAGPPESSFGKAGRLVLEGLSRRWRDSSAATSGALAPYVLAAGYWGSELTSSGGGRLSLFVFADDPQGMPDIQDVELYFEGVPTGVRLNQSGAGFYTYELEVPQGVLPGGRYLLELVARDGSGATSELWPYLEIAEDALAIESCTANPPAADIGGEVRFSCLHTGGRAPFSYYWEFGDGAATSEPAPVHSYGAYGLYNARVAVTDCVGVQIAGTVVVDVTPCHGGLEVFCNAEPVSGEAPLTVEFQASARCGTPPYYYTWSFGDGSVGAGAQAAHTYTSGGTFQACVTVSDSTTTKTCCIPITVGISVLDCGISADPRQGMPPLIVQFHGTATGGLAPYAFQWNFGDGTAGTGPEPTHTYLEVGSYQAAMTVSDAQGQTCGRVVDIAVQENHFTDHVISYPGGNTVLSTVYLVNVGSGDRLRWEWAVAGRHCRTEESTFTAGTTSASLAMDPMTQCGATSGEHGMVELYYNDVHFADYDRSFIVP